MTGLAFGTANAEVATDSIRRDTLEGRAHIVAPVVAVRSMVLKGEFLPAEEIEASAPAWNGRPLPINHPTDESGAFVSANEPATLSEASVGRFFNATADDGALTGEIWIDIQKATRLGGEAVEPLALLASHAPADVDVPGVDASNADADVLEVSTAYFYAPEDTVGTHNGDSYNRVQRNLRPDHLALLPNETGECSVEDGCGAPRVHVHQAAALDSSDATPARESVSPMNDDDIAWLATHSEFDSEALADMSDDVLTSLKATVEASHNDDECLCGQASTDPNNQPDSSESQSTEPASNDGGSDGDQGQASADLASAVNTLVDRVEGLEERFNAQEQAEREDYISVIEANSETMSGEELAELPTPTLESLAADYESQSPGVADYGGRIGAATQTADDTDTEAFAGMAARLAGEEE